MIYTVPETRQLLREAKAQNIYLKAQLAQAKQQLRDQKCAFKAGWVTRDEIIPSDYSVYYDKNDGDKLYRKWLTENESNE